MPKPIAMKTSLILFQIVLCLAGVVLCQPDADEVHQRSKRGYHHHQTITVPKPYPVYVPKPYPVVKHVPIKIKVSFFYTLLL